MTTLVARLGEIGQWLAGAGLLVMMLIGVVDIIGTKFFNIPLPGAYEATEALMVVAVFLALPYTQRQRQHIAVDLFVTRLGPRARHALDIVGVSLTFAIFALVAWRGWVLGLDSLAIREYASGIVQFPMYPSKLALAVGATLMALQCALDLAGTLRGTTAARPGAPGV